MTEHESTPQNGREFADAAEPTVVLQQTEPEAPVQAAGLPADSDPEGSYTHSLLRQLEKLGYIDAGIDI